MQTGWMAEKLTLSSPFRMRRRSIELKLHLGDTPPEVEWTVVQDMVKPHSWMAIIMPKALTEIAQAEGISKRRVQDLVDHAMLAPDILDAIAGGEQPDGDVRHSHQVGCTRRLVRTARKVREAVSQNFPQSRKLVPPE